HHQLLHAEPRDHVALYVERHEQLGQRVGADHRQGMRVEGQHGVGVVDHRPVAEVHAVEGPDGDPPPAVGTRLDLAQRYDPHDASTTYGFSWPSSVERAMARSRSSRVILTASPPATPAAIALP